MDKEQFTTELTAIFTSFGNLFPDFEVYIASNGYLILSSEVDSELLQEVLKACLSYKLVSDSSNTAVN